MVRQAYRHQCYHSRRDDIAGAFEIEGVLVQKNGHPIGHIQISFNFLAHTKHYRANTYAYPVRIIKEITKKYSRIPLHNTDSLLIFFIEARKIKESFAVEKRK
jgi:hypothetical protein